MEQTRGSQVESLEPGGEGPRSCTGGAHLKVKHTMHAVERLSSAKFLGGHISQNLSRNINAASLAKKSSPATRLSAKTEKSPDPHDVL